MLNTIIDGLMALSGWEVTASLLGIAYVILAARESQWCWPLAFISTLIYTVLFWDGQLPMQALLNFYYMAMAVYGFLLWRQHQSTEQNILIHSWRWHYQLAFLSIGGVLTLAVGQYLNITASSQQPFLDAGVTVFSVLNTWLMARKVIQNWLYWIAIDAVAIQLYWLTGFYATIAMFIVYLLLAVIGYINWQKRYQLQQAT